MAVMMRRAARQVVSALGPHVLRDAPAAAGRSLHAASSAGGGKKIVGVFYKGGEYADRNPDFVGCAEHALGIRAWLESQGHQYIVTHDKDGPNCAGGAGRIGRLLLQRLRPFGCGLLYHDRLRIEPGVEAELGAGFEADLDAMLPKCDAVVINMPLTDKTRGLFDKERIARMKRGVIIVNNARGAIMDTQAVADACATGHIAGYGGDVWHPQPAPKDHPWRYMPNNAMTPHISGTTIDGQLRYAAGVKDMLERYFKGQDFPAENYMVKEGKLAGQYQ
ncbi:unnamed protein product [Urochloa decumbens]|uniref:D-isomer specific 2-hydroxyacid dehydrogenase NAD-binding domain-containing protein n=1 Tax=Urochloa decumbens TaxID=240449 RepID=A0ABC9EDC9_9POAL